MIRILKIFITYSPIIVCLILWIIIIFKLTDKFKILSVDRIVVTLL